MKLLWTDAAEMGVQLYEKHPGIDPLTVRFSQLHQWAVELEGFADDPKKCNEKILETIQMSWYDEWKADED